MVYMLCPSFSELSFDESITVGELVTWAFPLNNFYVLTLYDFDANKTLRSDRYIMRVSSSVQFSSLFPI